MTYRRSPPQITGSGPLVGLTYFKRFRMEFDLSRGELPATSMPSGYRAVPWDQRLTAAHAEAKYRSFRTELDANVFPCLGSFQGCLRLMGDLSHRAGFLPESTWLLVYQPATDVGWLSFDRHGNYRGSQTVASLAGDERGLHDPNAQVEVCGAIQSIEDRGAGAIQNLGVVPSHRGRGLATYLMHLAMEGFRRVGLQRASLEVTARNEGAVRLYRRMGFVKVRTVYKAVEVESFATS